MKDKASDASRWSSDAAGAAQKKGKSVLDSTQQTAEQVKILTTDVSAILVAQARICNHLIQTHQQHLAH